MKQYAALALLFIMACLIETGCNSMNSSSTAPLMSSANMASLSVMGTDAPACDVISFEVTITSLTLSPQGGGTPVTVISSAQPLTVDFASLMDFSKVLNFSQVPAGTYTQATITLSNPQIVTLTATGPTPVNASLSSTQVSVTINPPLTVSSSQAGSLSVDLNLLKSLETGVGGQLTGSVSPVFTAEPVTLNPSQDSQDDLDHLHGLVQSVSTQASGNFTGSFTIQKDDGQTLTVYVTSSTGFDGSSGLSSLTAGTYVEVEASLDADNNIVASEVDAEDQEDESQHKAAFLGVVTSVEQNSQRQVTQFSMWVRSEYPDVSTLVPPHAMVTVNVSSETSFKTEARDEDRSGLTFGASAMAPGEHLAVHGVATAGSTPSIDAGVVFLRLQSVLGHLASITSSQNDDKTGSFAFIPCSDLFAGQPFTVLTFSQTAFAQVNGLNEIATTPFLVVKGLVFYEQTANSGNGPQWRAPGYVEEAKQVHQLP